MSSHLYKNLYIAIILPAIMLLMGLIAPCMPAHAVSTSDFHEINNTDIARGQTPLCVLRDRYGFLWVGTVTGLSCFDGNNTPFYISHSGVLASTEGANITTLFEHGDNIWFGEPKGLFIFERSKNKARPFPYKTKYGVPVTAQVQKIVESKEGLIWIITHGQGLFTFSPADSTLTQNSRHSVYYSDILTAKDGKVYAATLDGYLQTFDARGNYLTSKRLPDYVNAKHPVNMVLAGAYIWLSANNNLYRFDTRTKEIDLELKNVVSDDITSLLGGPSGQLMLGTYQGIHTFDTTTLESRPVSVDQDIAGAQLPDNRITAISYDKDGTLIAVTPAGISMFMRHSLDFVKVNMQPFPGKRNIVSALLATPDSLGVWVGAENGLHLYDLSTGQLTPNMLPSGNYKQMVTSLARQGDDLWIGTRHDGLIRLNTITGQTRNYTYDEKIPYSVVSNDINKVYRTSYDEIFVLTGWGICKYQPSTDNFVTLEIGSHIPFRTMQEDARGRLWTASNSAIFCRETPTNRFNLISNLGLGKSPVSMMRLDSRGTLWAVTQNNRLYRYNEEKSDFEEIHHSVSSEFPISFIEEDTDGNLWMGSPHGLARVGRDTKITYYPYSTGEDNFHLMNVSERVSGGKIVFECGDGFWMFDPRDIKDGNEKARVYVGDILFPHVADNDAELQRLDLDVLLYNRKKIKIPYSDNTFTLRLMASRYGDMPTVSFEYKLEGVDKEWIQTNSPEVTYTGLQPGTYRFLLRPGFGSEEDVEELTITVTPPWYATYWAYAVYALLLGFLIWLLAWVYRRRLKRQFQGRLNEMRVRKEREMFESKMRFFVNLVHEIRTPLTLISIPLEKMSESLDSGSYTIEKEKSNVRSMQYNVDYLLGITNQLLDFSKAQHDTEVRLNRHVTNINRLLTDIVRHFELPMEISGKQIVLHLPEEQITANIDADKLERVVMNIIFNGMKYSRHLIEVWLNTDEPSKEVKVPNFTITVSDDGPGVPQHERDRIFETFYQIGNDQTGAHLGTGLGLAYARLIARAHLGRIRAEANSVGGAKFVITIPEAKDMPETQRPELVEDDLTTVSADTLADNDATTERFNVLLVEDNDSLLRAMKEALGESHHIITASDGQQALEMLASNPDIDIIISDYMMPRMNGVELCRAVKSDINYSHIPFIILTAKIDRDAKVQSMLCGADVYLQKPFSIRQLNLQIANIMRTRSQFHRFMQSTDITRPEITSVTTGEGPATQTYLNRVDAEFISNLNKYLLENINDEEFSIDSQARQMNMSRSSFYRKVKAVTGMTPVDYLKTYRLDYAAKLLLDGMRVTEVTLMAGFTSSSYFAKCFKAKFGMIPKEYAASKQNGSTAHP